MLTSIDIFAIIPKYLENVFLNQIFRNENGEEIDQIRTYYNFKKQQSELCKEFIKLYMHALSLKSTSSCLT